VTVQPFLIGEGWVELLDGDESVRTIFDRHYSRHVYADGRKPKLFMGPGEKIVLMQADGSAIFGWRKFKSDDGQQGVNCAIFRREDGDEKGSALIASARKFAHARWPGERLFTYVDPRKVKPTMIKGGRFPVWGYCFYRDGWTFDCVTKSGKITLAREHAGPLSDGVGRAPRPEQTSDAVTFGQNPSPPRARPERG